MNPDDCMTKQIESYVNQKYTIYGSDTTIDMMSENMSYVVNREAMNFVPIGSEENINCNGINIKPIIADYCDGYFAYIISDTDKTVFYHPDFGTLKAKENIFVYYAIIDASATFGCDVHSTIEQFQKMNNKIESNNIISTNVSEHLTQQSTSVLRKRSEKYNIRVFEDNFKF